MIDCGFLLGYALGCFCTAALCRWIWKPHRYRYPIWHRPGRDMISTSLGAAARGEVADLAVSAGAFISSVRDMRRQIERAHEALKREG